MANQDSSELDDLRRAVRERGAPGMPDAVCEYEDFGISIDVREDGEDTMIAFTIGVKGSLSKHAARAAARLWHTTTAKYPKSNVWIQIGGYDTDPRELWHIPEVSLHVRRWASFADLRHILDAARTPLGPVSVSVMAKCGAFEDVEPETVPIAELAGGAKH